MPITSRNRPLVAPRIVRSWAAEKGIPIAERGRIPQEVVQRYRHSLVVKNGIARRAAAE